MSKKLTMAVFAIFCALGLSAQTYTGGVKGRIISRSTRQAIENASLTLYRGAAEIAKTVSDSEGNFLVENLADGMYDLEISATDFMTTKVNVTVNDGYVKNMFNLSLSPLAASEDIEEMFAEFDMDDSGYNDNPTVLYGQNDVYNSLAGYNFSAVRFRTRGYTSESQDVYLAGVRMNDAITGYTPFSLWSGLNEPTRSKDVVNGAEVSNYGIGGYNGLTNIPVTASNVRKGWRGSVLTNSSLYRLRLMMTYASGPLDNGWSYSFSASARLGGNDWIKGVYYRSFAYYGSVEKKLGDAHNLSLTFMATPGNRGAQNASTQEVYDLTGDNMYNSNWGYQNGKVRNARVRKTHEPIAILKYDYTPSNDFEAHATMLYRFGKNGYTALDWYDAADPRPDYYRNLPSYFYMENPDYNRLDPLKAAWAADAWQSGYDPNYSHINWDRLYNVNRNSIGEGGLHRSKYVQEERRVDQRDFNLAGNFKWRANDWLAVTGGANLRINRTEYYKTIADLLGGDYYVNIDNFAERDFASSPMRIQNDLDYYMANGRAQVLSKGDKYGYDYYAQVRDFGVWANGRFSFDNFSASLGGKIGYNAFWRDGLMRKGLFPGLTPDGKEYFDADGSQLTSYDQITGDVITSYGKSKTSRFLTGAVKASAEYHLPANQRVYANVGYFHDAPTFNQSFISPRTRNTIVNGITPVKTFTADLNYQISYAGYNVRLTGFYTTIKDQTDMMSFYDDLQNAFTNFSMTGIDQRHIGLEMGFKIPLPVQDLALQGAVSWGEYIYTSNPRMTQTVDNSSDVTILDQMLPYWKSHPVHKKDADGNYVIGENGVAVVDYIQKHYVPSTPQFASSLGLSWNHDYWFIDADVEYFANSYLDMNPLYRTDMATAGPDNYASPEEVEYMAAQEKFDPAFLVNLSIGKSWYIQRKYQIGFSLNARNILNNKGVKTGGYEQTRLVDNTVGKERYYRFDSKYFYMCGANYMLNIYFRF